MLFSALLLGALMACPAHAAPRAPEEKLRLRLAQVKEKHIQETRAILMGSAEGLRDAVAGEPEPVKKESKAAQPDFCRDLRRCPEAPLSMHVEDPGLINDAFLAMARPWFQLQKARGRDVAVAVEAGLGVQLKLEGLPRQAVVTFEAAPAESGGFDISLVEGPPAARVYASERAAALAAKTRRP